MTTKLFASALLASTLLIGPALAQSSQPAPAQTQPQAQQQPGAAASATMQEAGQMRSSRLVGLNVYNPNNDRIGDINELIVGRDGQVQHVIVGVGGFLGIGQRDVALDWNQVKFVDQPRGQTMATRPGAGAATTADRPAGTTGTGATGTTTGAAGTATAARNVPDHAVVDMTKEQLEQLPEYKYADNR